MDTKEIKSEIRKLRKLKLVCRAGTKERVDLHRQILALKDQLTASTTPDTEKDKVIAEILKIDKVMASIVIDLKKHNIEDLKKYLDKLKRRV